MKLHSRIVLNAVLIAALAVPAFCQEPSPAPVPDRLQTLTDQAAQMELDAEKLAASAETLSSDRMSALEDRIAGVAERFGSADQLVVSPDLGANLAQMKAQIDSGDFADMKAAAVDMANQVRMAFQAPAPPMTPIPPMPKARTILRGDGAYDAGTRALDQHRYEDAVQQFDAVIAAKSARSDGALYWKAYALNRLGKRDEALAALAQLRRDYASSPWLHDAQGLEAEVKQNAGQPVSPAQETNDDLKLMAINSLMNADAERAIPLVEGILKGNGAPNVKDRALFVLSQNKSPRAQQALTDYAKGGGNPDLQLRAIQYVGMSGTKEAQQQLVSLYGASSDVRVKGAIVQALMMAHASDALMNIAKTEKDGSLRDTAIRDLIMNKSVPAEGVAELYGSSDASAKREIINGLAARREAKALVDLAHKEADPALKRTIVERLGPMTDNKDAMDYMMELLK